MDHIKSSGLATLRKFILDDEGLDIKVVNRGMLPLGGGEIIFKCPVRKCLRPLQFTNPGMVKRIRGTVYALRVSPVIANRMVESSKGVLLKFLPDIYIHTDQCRGKQSGKSPGYGIHLVAETTNGVFYSAEQVNIQYLKKKKLYKKIWVYFRSLMFVLTVKHLQFPKMLAQKLLIDF